MRLWPALVMLGVAAAAGAAFGVWSKRPLAAVPEMPARVVAAAACQVVAGDPAQPGMAWIPGGRFWMGSDKGYAEEAPATQAELPGFWMDQTEVTNAQFAEFVAATGYRTLAERGIRISADDDAPTMAGSAVFQSGAAAPAIGAPLNWWRFVPDTSWRHPEGPDSSLVGREQHPVVHVAYEDALAYAGWKGRSLPTEAQWEYAAQGSGRRDATGAWVANTWQGVFPVRDAAADGFAGIAPVACFTPTAAGLHDLIGNVWEWTASHYFPGHHPADRARFPGGFDPTQPDEREVAVLKGGSFLCSPDYCMRYRPEARIGQSRGLGTSHIGFRTVLNP